MKTIHTFVTLAALFLCSPAVFAEEPFRPLDTRTRCIVLFRECLILVDKKDVNGIHQIIADGVRQDFKLYPDLDSLSPDMKRELQDVDSFFRKNFRNASLLNRTFHKLQFSELVTANELVAVINSANDEKTKAKLHTIKMKVRIPDTTRHEVAKLRFVQIKDSLYWVPFGW